MTIKSTKATKNLTMALSTSHINLDNVTELKSGVIGTLSNKPLNAVVKRKYTKRRPISTSEWRCETAGIGLHTLELYCRADRVKDVGWEGGSGLFCANSFILSFVETQHVAPQIFHI